MTRKIGIFQTFIAVILFLILIAGMLSTAGTITVLSADTKNSTEKNSSAAGISGSTGDAAKISAADSPENARLPINISSGSAGESTDMNDAMNSIKNALSDTEAAGKDGSSENSANSQKDDLESLVNTAAEVVTSVMDDKCSALGISDNEKCRKELLEQYSEKIKCEGLNDDECKTVIRQTFAQTISDLEEKYKQIEGKSPQIINKSLQVIDMENILNEGAQSWDITVPLYDKTAKVKVMKAVQGITIDSANKLAGSAPIAVTMDSDGDGIPDDIEKRIGTDPAKTDTDGDGYSDSQEILAGYDPLGPGKRDIAFLPIEEAIMRNETLEQPLSSGSEAADFSVSDIQNIFGKVGEKNGYLITGKALPGAIATIYMYSDIPIVTTVGTDEFGNWKYELDQPLTDGTHEVYIAINDNTGKITSKSKPMEFLVSQARAISPQEMANLKNENKKAAEDTIIYYMAASAALIIVGIIIFLFAIIKKKNNIQSQ